MISVSNTSPSPVLVEGFLVPPGSWDIPGEGVAFVDVSGSVTYQAPMRVESFSCGFLIFLPFLTVTVIRFCLRLFSSARLDRFV